MHRLTFATTHPTLSKLISACLLTLCLVALMVGSASAEESNLVETLRNDGRFDAFVAELDTAGMSVLLANHGPFTIFAPTDEAFANWSATQSADLTSVERRQLLLYHFVQGQVDATSIKAQTSIRSALGGSIIVSADADSVILNSHAVIIQSDIAASNGFVHIISAVLNPADAPTGTINPPAPSPEPVNEVESIEPAPDTATEATEPINSYLLLAADDIPKEVDTTIAPQFVEFSPELFLVHLQTLKRAMERSIGWIDTYGQNGLPQCHQYLYYYFFVANAPFYGDIPAEYGPLNTLYEQAISGFFESNEPLALGCIFQDNLSKHNLDVARIGAVDNIEQVNRLIDEVGRRLSAQ